MKLWLPGPTYVRPAILAQMARPPISHRSAAMAELMDAIDPGLAGAFGLWSGSSAHLGVASCSGTALMEAALHGVGERVLCLVGGAFAARWAEIARLLGKDAAVLQVPPGKLVDDSQLAEALDRDGPFDALTLVVNETSTGTRTPIQHVSNVLQAFPDTLLLCDVVSYLGGAPVDFDTNCLGFAFASVQKALALPPGIGVLCASEEYVERAQARPRGSFALDPLRLLRGHAERLPPATPSIPHYFALARQLQDIAALGWDARFARHARLQGRTEAWARGRGLAPFPEQRALSPTVACLRGGGVDVARLVEGLARRGFAIADGYGELKGETFRIGHLGDHTEEGLEELLAAADLVLAPG